MHALKSVTTLLESCLGELHAKQRESIQLAVNAALSGGDLSLSGLSQRLPCQTALRHRIKRMDRLLGNLKIRRARLRLYGEVARSWLEGIDQPLLVVDWSDITGDQQWHLLRASVAVEGRSVTLYEEVHPQKDYGSRVVHRRFLSRLTDLLPAACRPIVMTDAGFRSTWFDLVSERHWFWVGRVRGRDMIRCGNVPWRKCREFYPEAQPTVQDYPQADYVRSHPTPCRIVLVKRPARGRSCQNRTGRRSRANHSLKAARGANEPWVLACSRELAHLSADAVVALYAQRMRIEQSFRDIKSEHYGLGLHAAHSRSGARFEMLFLIGHLAAWVLRLIGECAQQAQLQLRFQVIARIDRKEISVITLARRLLDSGDRWLRHINIREGIPLLRQQAIRASTGATI